MKRIVLFICLCFSIVSFCQEKKIIKSGYITFNSNSILEFKSLTIENETVFFINEISKVEMTFPLTSIKKILDWNGEVVYQSVSKNVKIVEREKDNKSVLVKKTENELLVYKSASKIYLNGNRLSNNEIETLLNVEPSIYEQYEKGKNGALLGNILLGGGIGLFIGGGINNLMLSSSQSGGGGPALLIVGLVTGVIGIPVKIGGVKNIKQAITRYNALPKKQVSFLDNAELKIIASSNGVGFQFQF